MPVVGPTDKRPCIVTVCSDMGEADQIGRQLLEFNSGYLVTYRRLQDFAFAAPAAKVALVILATKEDSTMLRRILKWLRHRWPRCPITVVGDAGGGKYEVTAREGGASYLTRPVEPRYWAAILAHALGQQARVDLREFAG